MENLINQFKQEVDKVIENTEEKELFDMENHILWIDYRNHRFKIYLDAERHILVGDVLLDNEIDIIGVESDSLDCLVEKLERHTDEQISYRFQSQLAKESIQHQDRIRELDRSSTILQQYYLQLERLALKDKKDEFSPFELRQQLVEISILFSGILDKRLEDVKKDYCEMYPTVKYNFLPFMFSDKN